MGLSGIRETYLGMIPQPLMIKPIAPLCLLSTSILLNKILALPVTFLTPDGTGRTRPSKADKRPVRPGVVFVIKIFNLGWQFTL